MITINRPDGLIHLSVLTANDVLTIQGLCGHGVSLFDFDHDCVLEELITEWQIRSELFNGN